MNNPLSLSKEDYEEPCCPLKTPSKVSPIPVGRVIEKLDEYLHRNDYAGAERHLLYWCSEADAGNDKRGKLTLLNELIGLYRKTENPEKGIPTCESAYALSEDAGLSDTVTMGTTCINIATAYKSFGSPEKALPLYEQAKTIYEKNLEETDSRLAGLYNNMALTVMDSGDLQKAHTLFEKALDVLAKVPDSEPEVAITHCNLADLAALELGTEAGEETICAHLDAAEALLNGDTIRRDGYYAFVCEKCAPTFGYYGYFFTQEQLLRRAKEIYERS